jgi:hypothetical protein
MISDALMLADSHLKISDSIFDPESYTYLTDSIIKTIEGSKDPVRTKDGRLYWRSMSTQ